MTVTPYLVASLGFAALTWMVRGRREAYVASGVAGLVATLFLALLLDPAASISFGSIELAGSAYLRLFLLAATLVGIGLALSGLAGESRDHGAPVILATLGIGGLTLGLADPLAGVMAGSAAGAVSAVITVVPTGDRAGATAGIRGLRAVAIAAALGIGATAWIGRDLSDLQAQPVVVYGLAYLAMAGAVAIRFGAIPFHLWAARLTDVIPESALPVVTVLAAAPFAIVGAGWIEASTGSLLVDLGTERGLVLAVAVGSVVMAAIAALLQDELEHVVGYSIVGDAGVALLGLVALGPESGGAMLTWILLLVVGRAAFAAWAASVRASFGTGRISELYGWMTRAPILTAAFGLIVVAAIGVPGFAAFEARSLLVGRAVEGPLAPLVAIAVLAPLAYYGRLVSVGVGRPRYLGRGEDWRPNVEPVDLTAPLAWWRQTWQRNRRFAGSVVALALGLLAVATSAGAFGAAEASADAARARGAPVIASPTGDPGSEPASTLEPGGTD
jgi:NADH-quinone oxidoreductase subunit N